MSGLWNWQNISEVWVSKLDKKKALKNMNQKWAEQRAEMRW